MSPATPESSMDVVTAAKIAHEVNRAYCQAIGDHSQQSWHEAPEWQRTAALQGVRFHVENPTATPEQSHESWLEAKRADGWVWGPVKDPDAREHPCMRPYIELAVEQRAKDYLFRAVAHTVLGLGS